MQCISPIVENKMAKEYNLQRFLEAQEAGYEVALSEIKNGRKRSHWMWYIFPQIRGLGSSETSRYYAIEDIREAEAFLTHPILGSRLVAICNELVALPLQNATQIFGYPDDIKLKSSMTLFAAVAGSDPVFQSVLEKYFHGTKDATTLRIAGIAQ
jgi:uncharacterized protein (DUF1810 family)